MIRNALNEIHFALRRRFFSKIQLRSGNPPLRFTNDLEKEYRYYSTVLLKSFTPEKAKAIHQVIDIGCRNWSYVQSLADFFPTAHLTGIEVDGGRRYWNLYRRIDLARAYADQVKKQGRKVEVFGEDFRDLNLSLLPQKTLFCFFFPFVSENPCLSWGLPKRFADFASLLAHSQQLAQNSESQPLWMSLHQGEWEAEEAEKVYDQLRFPVKKSVVLASEAPDSWRLPYDSWIFSSKC